MEREGSVICGDTGVRDVRAQEYFLWKGDRASNDFKSYIKNVRGVMKLSHSGILKDAGIADSLARSNPFIREDLETMESDLRELGLLPPVTHLENSPDTRQLQPLADSVCGKPTRSLRDKQRIESLEQELAQVKLERDDARDALKRYDMLEQYMSETLRLPR